MTPPRLHDPRPPLRNRGTPLRLFIILLAYVIVIELVQWLEVSDLPLLFTPAFKERSYCRRGIQCRSVSESVDAANRDPVNAQPRKLKTPISIKYIVPVIATIVLFATGASLRPKMVTITGLYKSSFALMSLLSQFSMLIARLPVAFIEAYGDLAIRQPVLTKALTSGVAYVIGDVLAQFFEGRRRPETIDTLRSLRNGLAGFLLHGPALHFWIQFLEGPFASMIGAGEHWWAVCAKILIDQTLFASSLTLAYALLLGVLSAQPIDGLWRRARQTLIPSMYSSWRFWPFVHLITYSPFMPIQFKVLWNDVMEIVWVAILSVIANDEKIVAPA